jgi:tetratricopeptide (TPR) repeat protein
MLARPAAGESAMPASARRASRALLCAALSLAAACSSAPASDEGRASAGARLYAGFEGYSRPITTDSAEAQRWFDQGLLMLYGFNQEEALRSFARAAELDPDCAMASWGVAFALEGMLDHPDRGAAAARQAYAAAQEALARLDDESPAERSLVRAIARRRGPEPVEDRSALDEAYAAAMEEAFGEHPDDPDVGALFAESLMALQPWNLWTPDGRPEGRALEIVGVLEEVLGRHPRHPGANHFLIHALEASHEPERALAAAEVLVDLVPGAGHLVHMPSHLWIRTGDYARAVEINRRSIAADAAYLALAPPPDLYHGFVLHNFHFLAYAAMMSGDRATAEDAARQLELALRPELVERHPQTFDALTPLAMHVAVRFGAWDAILRAPEFPQSRLAARAVRHYARALALANLGRTQEARQEQRDFEDAAARMDERWAFGSNPAWSVLAVARETMEGEILFEEGAHAAALEHLRRAAALQDELLYDEPPGWPQPARHALGALLLAAGHSSEAESVFRRDLDRHPENVWGLIGLAGALGAQGADASPVEARLARAWRGAGPAPAHACPCAADEATADVLDR